MDIVQILLIIFTPLNLAFAGFLYLHSDRRAVVVFYALISIFASLWSFSTLLTGIHSLSFDYSRAAIQGHYIFGYLAYLSFFWFSLFYPSRAKNLLWPLVFSVASLIFLGAIPTTNLLFLELLPGVNLEQQIVFNLPGYVTFILALSGVFFAGLFVLIRRFKREAVGDRREGFDKYQIYLAILSNLIAGVLGISLNLILPLYGNFSFFYVNPILVTLALTGIGLYNLTKYSLFNAKVVLAEFFTASIWILFFARLVLSVDSNERNINIISLVGSVVFGLFLIQSVLREVRVREEIEKLALDLEQANEKLKEFDRLKSEFLSMGTHQLRSPLTAIKGYASLILEGSFGKVPKTIEEAVDRIYQSSRSMANTIEDFLTISRIEQNRMKYDFVVTDVSKIVKDVMGELAPNAIKAKLQLSYVDDKKAPYNVNIDIGKIRQVIINFLDNAMKYTPKGSITVRVGKNEATNKILVSFVDTGVGMTQETIGKLFQRFTRAADANKVNVMGTGLGLFVAKEMISAHKGGRVWAESEGPGKGSQFYVELDAA